MSKQINNSKKQLSKMEHGQVLVVVAVSIVVLIAIMGLALDVGVMFIGNARMRRAVDAAALAAALQFRKGVPFSDLDSSANEFLRLNGINEANAVVQVCDSPDYHPDSLHTIPVDKCPSAGQMERKLVRVVATGHVALAFLQVIGINSVPIAAEAISEAASVDVVLVIDRSESMTYTAAPGTQERDPSFCNTAANPDPSYQGYCLPFDQVKRAAVSFVDSLYFPYDRVSVITFDKDAKRVLDFSSDKNTIISKIKGLTVFQGDETATGTLTGLPGINAIYPNGLPSRYYNPLPPPLPPTGTYLGLGCPQVDPDYSSGYPNPGNPAPCTTTNIGMGLYYAGMEFNIAPVRKTSLWVVILLTDGVANAGYDEHGVYLCPGSLDVNGNPTGTWGNADSYDFSVSPPVLISVLPKCNSGRTKSNPANRHSPISSILYDAEDYAYDAADYVANDQKAIIFTIGLGVNVITPSTADGTKLGEKFLQYAARCTNPVDCAGLYSYAPSGLQLDEVFRKIAQNIFTRLTH
jgi:hypothetical protein